MAGPGFSVIAGENAVANRLVRLIQGAEVDLHRLRSPALAAGVERCL
jgi:hypothetical protein